VLQQMRSAARYLWWILAVAFVGGYLLLDTSGLLGQRGLSQSTAIGEVNGVEITYGQWYNYANDLARQREQQTGRAVDLDERALIDDQAFDELVMAIIQQQEFDRRGIGVTEDEIQQAARMAPPPALMQNPELQTDGRFDPAKWERFLASPAVRQQGILLQLQRYYETEIPKLKFYDQVANEVYVSTARLWRTYQDRYDSTSFAYVAFKPTPAADTAALAQVTAAEIAAYYAENRKRLQMSTRARVSVIAVSREPSAADSLAMRDRLVAARTRITRGESFEAVAKEVSDDSVSAVDGGKLPPTAKSDFGITEISDALAKLRPGQLSEPIKTSLGWHIVRLDARKGDTLTAHHILVHFRQSDSSATMTDRLADSLARIATGVDNPSRLDTAARRLNLPIFQLDVIEGQRAMSPNGLLLAGLSQWATNGAAQDGEVSEVMDSDNAYFIARLDSLTPGGDPPLERVRDDIRAHLARKKSAESRLSEAREFARSAAQTSLEAAARARNYQVETTAMVTRMQFVPGLGQGHAAAGAAFSLTVGAVSEPIAAPDGVYVIRVEKRINASRTAWEAQLPTQRAQLEQQVMQDRYRQYLTAIRDAADVVDKRREVFAANRGQ
jgi:peptidyl-prolyl cis-trans isomerase D